MKDFNSNILLWKWNKYKLQLILNEFLVPLNKFNLKENLTMTFMNKIEFIIVTCQTEFHNSLNEAVTVFNVALIVPFVCGLQVEHVHCGPVFIIHPRVAPGLSWYIFW